MTAADAPHRPALTKATPHRRGVRPASTPVAVRPADPGHDVEHTLAGRPAADLSHPCLCVTPAVSR